MFALIEFSQFPSRANRFPIGLPDGFQIPIFTGFGARVLRFDVAIATSVTTLRAFAAAVASPHRVFIIRISSVFTAAAVIVFFCNQNIYSRYIYSQLRIAKLQNRTGMLREIHFSYLQLSWFPAIAGQGENMGRPGNLVHACHLTKRLFGFGEINGMEIWQPHQC